MKVISLIFAVCLLVSSCGGNSEMKKEIIAFNLKRCELLRMDKSLDSLNAIMSDRSLGVENALKVSKEQALPLATKRDAFNVELKSELTALKDKYKDKVEEFVKTEKEAQAYSCPDLKRLLEK